MTNLLNKHLTDDLLCNCYSDNALVSLTTAVMHLLTDNPVFMNHVDRLLVRLSQLKTNDKIERLLHNALNSDLHLKITTKEEIYHSQRSSLIEKPLLDSFMRTFPNANEKNCTEKQCDEETLNRLLILSTESARVFQLTFSFLKELLVQLQYAPAVIDFIDLVLKRVTTYCENQNKDTLDLYPRRLRFCVILLKIRPEHHTAQTRKHTLQTIKQIFIENQDAALILMSHFPMWLKFLPIHDITTH